MHELHASRLDIFGHTISDGQATTKMLRADGHSSSNESAHRNYAQEALRQFILPVSGLL